MNKLSCEHAYHVAAKLRDEVAPGFLFYQGQKHGVHVYISHTNMNQQEIANFLKLCEIGDVKITIGMIDEAFTILDRHCIILNTLPYSVAESIYKTLKSVAFFDSERLGTIYYLVITDDNDDCETEDGYHGQFRLTITSPIR